jgi:hypothetical protein
MAGARANGSNVQVSRIGGQAQATSAVPAISDDEFDELAALRKAQAWNAPMFQPSHPSYQRAMARLRELQAKERRLCGLERADKGVRPLP